ncbi:MAG: hypothetical protein WBW48_17645 [Anaerolineae bacterium]
MLGLNKKFGSIILGVILVLGGASLAYAFSFTPDIIVLDSADNPGHPGCVGVTMPALTGYNGWDIDQVGLHYDSGTDTLYVGISMWNNVIAGDVDNNGNPGTKNPCLGSFPAQDYANLGGPAGQGEAIDFVFDPDNDGTYEYIAGVSYSTVITGFAVANYTGIQPPLSDPGAGYGAAAGTGSVTNNPSTANPDFEFIINNFSSLRTPGSGEEMLDFNFVVRAGSRVDAGTGEDILKFDWNPTAVTLSSFAAKSSAGGSASPLWLGLAGLTVLAAGSLFWAKRWAG